NPEAKPLLKRCDFKSQCEENAAYLLAEEIACVRGYKNALIDSGVALKDMAVSIGQFVEKNWENLKQNVRLHENFIRQCDQSLACKRDLIKDDSRFNKISDEELQKISASFLYVQSRDMRAYTSSLARASSDSLRKNGMSLAEEQHSKLQDMMNIAKEKMQEEYKKYSCYTSLAKTEMSCYAFGNVVDPTLVFGAAFKGARLAAATGKLAEAAKAEEAVRTGDSIVAKVSQVRNRFLTREVLTKEFLSYSPTTVAENERWIALAEKGVDPHLRYLDVENSQLKSLNDVLKDKNLVTSLTNYHKKLLFDKIESLKKDFPNLNIEQYSDYKSSRFVFGGDIPKELEQKLQQIFKETNQEFSDYLKSEHILRDSDLSNDWFRAGLGQSAEQANVAARYSRQEVQNEVQNYSQEK
ncbi:MAG TPA: hypothetical protein VN132_11450, partial [Bdellovibrio sp.]|nr:hypothetical protein [Bdellovibrio sp.]